MTAAIAGSITMWPAMSRPSPESRPAQYVGKRTTNERYIAAPISRMKCQECLRIAIQIDMPRVMLVAMTSAVGIAASRRSPRPSRSSTQVRSG
jgi:hypothetical protein